MILTDIKQTKKGRYALFCNEKFQFSVDEEILVKYDLKEGMSITEEALSELLSESDFNRAKEKAYRLLTYRNHSRSELTEKLEQSFDEHTACAVAEKMAELGCESAINLDGGATSTMLFMGKQINMSGRYGDITNRTQNELLGIGHSDAIH